MQLPKCLYSCLTFVPRHVAERHGMHLTSYTAMQSVGTLFLLNTFSLRCFVQYSTMHCVFTSLIPSLQKANRMTRAYSADPYRTAPREAI